MTYLTKGFDVYTNNTIILSSNPSEEISFYSTTKPLRDGKYYYEVNHKEGDLFPILGFSFSLSKIQGFFLLCRKMTFQTYILGNISIFHNNTEKALDRYYDFNFPKLTTGFTVGLAYDSFSKLFSIYYENEVQRFQIKPNFEKTKITPMMFELSSTSKILNDKIHVNFGQETFHYHIPPGYVPWMYSFHILTCSRHNSFFIQFIYLILLF